MCDVAKDEGLGAARENRPAGALACAKQWQIARDTGQVSYCPSAIALDLASVMALGSQIPDEKFGYVPNPRRKAADAKREQSREI